MKLKANIKEIKGEDVKSRTLLFLDTGQVDTPPELIAKALERAEWFSSNDHIMGQYQILIVMPDYNYIGAFGWGLWRVKEDFDPEELRDLFDLDDREKERMMIGGFIPGTDDKGQLSFSSHT